MGVESLTVKIFIPGGAGYVGSKLVPALLGRNYEVIVFDLFLYGKEVFSALGGHPKLSLIQGDVRDFSLVEKSLQGVDSVIHLACISNDPSFELNPALGKSINLDSFEPFVKLAKQAGVRRFIYASSSSVYGVKNITDVTEEVSLEPLTDYSKFKAACEEILLRYVDESFIGTILRPATVCGYSPRQRLDVIVNILTNQAYHKGKIQVTGGSQMRPNIHIEDMVRSYIHVLESSSEKIQGEIFNIGYENHTVKELADRIQKKVGKKKQVDIEVIPTSDNRSYHISSKKIQQKLQFIPQYTIEDAVESLLQAFEQGKLPNSLTDAKYFNIQTMKQVNLI